MAGDVSLIIRDVKLASWLLGKPVARFASARAGVMDVTVPGAGKGGVPVMVRWPIDPEAFNHDGASSKGPPPSDEEIA